MSASYEDQDVLSEWEDLSDAQKEYRLKLSASILNTLPWRGAKACRDQNLAFPRWWRWDDGYPFDEDTYLLYSDIIDYTPPTTPQEVLDAQCEITIQVVHSGILKAEMMAFPEKEVKSFELGGSLGIEFFGNAQYGSLWSKAKLSSLDIIEVLLEKWIARVSGEVV